MPVPVVQYGGAVLVNDKRYTVVPNPAEPGGDPLLVAIELPTVPGVYTAQTADGRTWVLALDGQGRWTVVDLTAASRTAPATPTGLQNMHGFTALYLEGATTNAQV